MKFKLLINFCRKEIWIIIKLAFPVYLATLTSELNKSFIPLIFAGHFGNTSKNYAAITLSISIVMFFGTLPHMCLSSALNTLASQAYGAGKHKYLGTLLQRSICVHLLMCFPIILVYLNTANILIVLGQTAELAALSSEYIMVCLLILPADAILYPTMRILQVQDIALPSTVIFGLGSVLEAIGCYFFIYKMDLGIRGIALGVVISLYFMAISHLLYIRTMSVWCKIWDGWKWEALEKLGQYVYYGMPLLVIMWVEALVYYIGIILVGSISQNPAFEISVYSVILNLDLFMFILSVASNSATSIRIGFLVGEGDIGKMKGVALLTSFLIFVFQMLQILILLAGRHVLGYIFTSDEKVIDAILNMIYLLAAYIPISSVAENFNGILVGIGKQSIGILFPILFFVITVPIATILTVVANLGPFGFVLGICIGMYLRIILPMLTAFCCINWNKIVRVDYFGSTNTISIDRMDNSSEQSLLISQITESSDDFRQSFNDEFTIKKRLSLLVFKFIFVFICLTFTVWLISCDCSTTRLEFNIGNSYLKSPLDLFCFRFSTLKTALNNSFSTK